MIESAQWQEKLGRAEGVLDAEQTEAVTMMLRQEEPVLRFCLRLLALVRIVLAEQEAKFPRSRWSVVVVALFAKMLSILRGALTLARAGHGWEVPILTRSALEALITLSFIVQQDRALRARRWAQFGYVLKYKLMRKHPRLYRGAEYRNLRRRVRDRARRAQRHFPRDFWGSAVHCPNLRDMADKVGLLWHYDAVYWFGSQPTHSSVIAVDDHLALAANGTPIYKVGLSGQNVHREMAAYCSFMIRGLERLNGTFNLDITPIIDDAKSEYRRTLAGDPLQPDESEEETTNVIAAVHTRTSTDA